MEYEKRKIKVLGTFNPNSSQRRIVYDKNYNCPTLRAESHGNLPKVVEVEYE